MQRVGIIGANGFVGKALCAALHSHAEYEAVPIVRASYDVHQKEAFDVLINCAMPSARFWAKQHPQQDFEETVTKTANLLYGWNTKKLIQVSTVSARCQLDTVYGRHKAAAERLCDSATALIVRCGALYSPDMTKGVLMDMVHKKKVFIDGASRYCFAPVSFVAGWIVSNLSRAGIVEIGGRSAISLQEIADHLGGGIEFEGAIDHQEVDGLEPGLPEARDVLAFLDEWKKFI